MCCKVLTWTIIVFNSLIALGCVALGCWSFYKYQSIISGNCMTKFGNETEIWWNFGPGINGNMNYPCDRSDYCISYYATMITNCIPPNPYPGAAAYCNCYIDINLPHVINLGYIGRAYLIILCLSCLLIALHICTNIVFCYTTYSCVAARQEYRL